MGCCFYLNAFDVWFLGPLLPVTHLPRENENMRLVGEVQAWLEEKPHKSVVYVSFGSHRMPRASQLAEIFIALKKLDKPIISSLNPRRFGDLLDGVTVIESGRIITTVVTIVYRF